MDLVFLAVVIYFIATNRGFVNTLIEALGFIFSLGISYKLYGFFGKFLVSNFSLPVGFGNAIGFFIGWFIAEAVFFLIISKILSDYIKQIQKQEWDRYLGFVSGIIQALVVFLFFISLVFALPVRGQVKKAILDSRTGPFFVNFSQVLEGRLKNVFGQAVNESLNFLTIKPRSSESIDLGSKVPEKEATIDAQSEQIMFGLVNQERAKEGKKQLVFDERLRDVARNYAFEMFNHGFFSHVSAVDGSSPADRADRAGIEYQVIGENLALAPDVYMAHQGLMNSPGHRANILLDDYGKVGIGVVDGGVFGRIFVQEFTN